MTVWSWPSSRALHLLLSMRLWNPTQVNIFSHCYGHSSTVMMRPSVPVTTPPAHKNSETESCYENIYPGSLACQLQWNWIFIRRQQRLDKCVISLMALFILSKLSNEHHWRLLGFGNIGCASPQQAMLKEQYGDGCRFLSLGNGSWWEAALLHWPAHCTTIAYLFCLCNCFYASESAAAEITWRRDI